MTKTLLYWLALILTAGESIAQNNSIDSLKLLFASSRDDHSRLVFLHSLCNKYMWSFADTAIMYAKQEVEIAQKINDEVGLALSLVDVSEALTTSGDYANGLYYGFRGLTLSKESKDTEVIRYALSSLAICYREQGDYAPAIFYNKEDLRLGELTNHDYTISEATLSSMYERNNQLDSALFYAERAYKEVKNWSGLLAVLGNIHAKLRHDAFAIDLYRKSIPFAMQAHYQIDIVQAYNGMANVYLNEGKTDSAIYYAKEVLTQKWGRVYPIGLLDASNLLAHVYEINHLSDSALKYLKQTIALKDSLFSREKSRSASSIAFNEQLHQQELQQKVEQNELKYRNRLNIYLFVAGLVIMLIIAAGLWRRNIFKQKSFAQLQKQKQETDNQRAKVEQTLEDLKRTQSQLIQSEKMASLGELTAGIAHEIQNPLNFVNNFSEVNLEMNSELKGKLDKLQIPAADKNEIDELISNIENNEAKIIHHGKRADAIVKGMLQHSRSSSGEMELVNINAIADECMRLSYHGLRAKDKSFQANLQTDFDDSIDKIPFIQQDVVRVLVNLFNNAFYAVNEKSKEQVQGYEPTVSVSTKKSGNQVSIIVRDNGNGIPEKVVDKIFQPFFTTKQTGQGTGLGLSLSYDIVKAHRGEISVNTKEGKFTEFVIQLSTNSVF